mmetsp:Transcript_122192/g.317550  ORF Transcript_122192/g.317550 Transcript_122192/m.317550 type:complete len:206 (-) Transcript_122192:790-1407(-)
MADRQPSRFGLVHAHHLRRLRGRCGCREATHRAACIGGLRHLRRGTDDARADCGWRRSSANRPPQSWREAPLRVCHRWEQFRPLHRGNWGRCSRRLAIRRASCWRIHDAPRLWRARRVWCCHLFCRDCSGLILVSEKFAGLSVGLVWRHSVFGTWGHDIDPPSHAQGLRAHSDLLLLGLPCCRCAHHLRVHCAELLVFPVPESGM